MPLFLEKNSSLVYGCTGLITCVKKSSIWGASAILELTEDIIPDLFFNDVTFLDFTSLECY